MTSQPVSQAQTGSERLGILLIFLSAVFWSIGGTIARFLETPDSWTIVFWRSLWAAAFLLSFMVWRDGLKGMLRLFAGMGLPGIAVGCCFALCSSAFVIALSYTTVANVLLIQAGVPLFAALLSWLVFRERIALPTWIAIAGVIAGVGVMVSDSLTGKVSPIGDGLALLIAIGFSIATVITRRYAHVRMVPATCLGTLLAGTFAATQAGTLAASTHDMLWLVVFGAVNLGLGLALFATGARLIPAALAALMGTFEPVLGPIWAWLVHGEIPSSRTLIGGAIVMVALTAYLAREFARRAARRPAVIIGP